MYLATKYNQKWLVCSVTKAGLLMNLRGIPHYEVTMCTGMNTNTVKRLEEDEGGVTLEDGFRYFIYAEIHKSKPNLMRKFCESMASYQSEQEQAIVVIAQQKQRRSENLRKEFERRKIENTTRQSVQMEMSERLTSNPAILQ